jgi:hypothetical protein
MGILEFQIQNKNRFDLKQPREVAGQLSCDIRELLEPGPRQSSMPEIHNALTESADANAKDKSGPFQLVYLLDQSYDTGSD